MLILNGRTLGDLLGKYTCFKWNGNSVVDYIVGSSNFLHRVKNMTIGCHTLYSDHNPVQLHFNHFRTEISSETKNNPAAENAPLRYKITQEGLTSFKAGFEEPAIIDAINEAATWAVNAEPSTSNAKTLASKVTSLICSVAECSLEKSKPPSSSISKHGPWFDQTCKNSRCLTFQSLRVLSKHPDNQRVRDRHRTNKNKHRKIIKTRKDKFLKNVNNKIKNGKIVSWKDFKKLQMYKKDDPKLDTDLLGSFQCFYQQLYSDEHPTIDSFTKQALLGNADHLAMSGTPNETLNAPITFEELQGAISSLKTGKASSFDQINNEMIKSLNPGMTNLILTLFNMCLSSGSYMWSKSVIIPLHKKGPVSNPDNYRAISVCSCLGKLFSTVLLSRLITHRSNDHPDPPNQAGFTKGSQCADHIFVLMSIAEKYKKIKCKVYAVFVDLRKAFDLVCRQALLFKLACYGVNGGFYEVMKSMYEQPTGNIKLNGKLSNSFPILKGTGQGNPLSPELFKVYFKELSDLLNTATTTCPTLSGKVITHLAWADDLVILSLDSVSLQKQVDIVANYCKEWGLEVNIAKTKFMVINGKCPPDPDWRPRLNNTPIKLVSSYCYLGVIISSNGKFKQAVGSLYSKGLGAYISFRNTVDRQFIDTRSFDKLFEALVSPILSYGCQIWLPNHPVINRLLSTFQRSSSIDLRLVAKLPSERVHLRHIKYMLGLNRRSVNTAAWGETGKLPLFVKSLGQCIKFFRRVMSMDSHCLVKAAMNEQVQLNLSWFSGIKSIISCFDNVHPSVYQRNSPPLLNASLLARTCSPQAIIDRFKGYFIAAWKESINLSSKLAFFKQVKDNFQWEHYLDICDKFDVRRSTAQIRCSAHKLTIETGRHDNTPRNDRICPYCLNKDGLFHFDDENHLLKHCPLGRDQREACNDGVADLPIFNIASTYPRPGNLLSSPSDISESDVFAIKLTCKTVHCLYQARNKYMRNLRDSAKVNPSR